MIEKLTDEQLEVLNQGEDGVNLTTIAGWILSDVESLSNKIIELGEEDRSSFLAHRALLEAHSYLRDALYHLSMSHLNDNKNDIA